MIRLTFLLIALYHAAFSTGHAQQSTPRSTASTRRLAKALEQTISSFRGQVGIYVRNLRTGQVVALNADSLFPTASTVKIPIQCGLFNKIRNGELTYEQELVYRDSLHYDDGIVGSLKDGTRIPLSQVVLLMESVSDNTGSLWCQALAGGGTAINQWLDTSGFRQTRVNSRTPGREAFQKQYGWGQTTPRELANLLVYIREGKAVSPDASDEMYRNLGRQYWDHDGLSQLPPGVKAVTKNGAVNQSRSEVVLVHAPHGEYVYCVMTKNQQDENWGRTNEGSTLLRTIGNLLWHHFEPKSNWVPPTGYEKWW
jgi:beta-lactamase class A